MHTFQISKYCHVSLPNNALVFHPANPMDELRPNSGWFLQKELEHCDLNFPDLCQRKHDQQKLKENTLVISSYGSLRFLGIISCSSDINQTENNHPHPANRTNRPPQWNFGRQRAYTTPYDPPRRWPSRWDRRWRRWHFRPRLPHEGGKPGEGMGSKKVGEYIFFLVVFVGF